jgi:hypothetical protein
MRNYQNLTLESMPSAIAFLIEEMSEVKKMLKATKKATDPLPKSRTPIQIKSACKILNKARSTVYALSRKGVLPSYKKDGSLYFFEDDLIKYIETGKKKTNSEILKEVEEYNYNNKKRR